MYSVGYVRPKRLPSGSFSPYFSGCHSPRFRVDLDLNIGSLAFPHFVQISFGHPASMGIFTRAGGKVAKCMPCPPDLVGIRHVLRLFRILFPCPSSCHLSYPLTWKLCGFLFGKNSPLAYFWLPFIIVSFLPS